MPLPRARCLHLTPSTRAARGDQVLVVRTDATGSCLERRVAADLGGLVDERCREPEGRRADDRCRSAATDGEARGRRDPAPAAALRTTIGRSRPLERPTRAASAVTRGRSSARNAAQAGQRSQVAAQAAPARSSTARRRARATPTRGRASQSSVACTASHATSDAGRRRELAHGNGCSRPADSALERVADRASKRDAEPTIRTKPERRRRRQRG